MSSFQDNQCLSQDLKIRIFYPCFKESQFNSGKQQVVHYVRKLDVGPVFTRIRVKTSTQIIRIDA